jgi:hypothetical protein
MDSLLTLMTGLNPDSGEIIPFNSYRYNGNTAGYVAETLSMTGSVET